METAIDWDEIVEKNESETDGLDEPDETDEPPVDSEEKTIGPTLSADD